MQSDSISSSVDGTQSHQDLKDIGVGYVLIVGALWCPLPWAGLVLLVALAWIAYRTIASGARLGDLGLRLSAIRRDFWLVSAAALVAAGSAYVAWRYNTLHAPFGDSNPELQAGAYLLWSLVQQFILQSFFLVRLLRLMPSKTAAAFTAAGLFAVAHFPNPILMVATLVWGLVACAFFLHYRDFYTLGVVHAVLGLSLAVTIPAGMHHDMRVGLGYLRYHAEQPQRGDLRIRVTPQLGVAAGTAAE